MAYSADGPIQSVQSDRFRRSTYALRLAKTIASRSHPSSLVIGLNAPWGEGKTSILKMLEEELKNHDHVIVMWFNPWNFGTQEQLLTGYFNVLAAALKKNLKQGKEIVGDVITTIGVGVNAVTGFFGLSGEGVKQAGEALSSIDLEEQKRRLSEILRSEQKRVVVFMDDIDRLDKSEIQAVFKMVKLTVDFDYITYVLAFDNEVVSAALQERYGTADPEAGRRFLEKIIQVPLQLPLLQQDALFEYALQALDRVLDDSNIDLTASEEQAFLFAFSEGLLPRITTPRVANLYANTVQFALPLMLGEVNTVDFMLIEGMRVLYPRLYQFVREHPDVFLVEVMGLLRNAEEHKKQQKAEIDQALSDLDRTDRAAAMKLLEHLFPKMKSIYSNYLYTSDSDLSWARDKKVASHAYFKRYFAYGVPQTDVSDLLVESWLHQARTEPAGAISGLLQEAVNGDNARMVMQKLRQMETIVSVEPALVLAKALALISHNLPGAILVFDSAKAQAAIWTFQLIKRLPTSAEQVTRTLDLFVPDIPLDFQVELYRWFKVGLWKDNPELQSGHADLETKVLERLVEQIEQLAGTGNLLESHESLIARMLSLWATHRSREATQAHLLSLFDRSSEHLFTWMKLYLPAQGPALRDIEPENYAAMGTVVDPEEIASRLEGMFPQWNTPEANQGQVSSEAEMARAFLLQHQAQSRAGTPETE